MAATSASVTKLVVVDKVLALEAQTMSIRIHESVAEFDRRAVRPRSLPSVPRRPRLYRGVGKRMLDIFLVILALPAILPVIALFAVLIARDGHSPFYRQERVGRNGKIFVLWKLRSMVPDAKAALERHLVANPAARAEWDAYQKLSVDPRITEIGHFIRKSSLDEIPQLWNVLKGDMSLVGPRPMMPEQRDIYPGSAYYTLRPGLTGPWQITDRNASTFAQRADYDANYARDVSLVTDAKIIFATVGVVLRCTGQ